MAAEDDLWTEEADVVVVGGGGAGMAAAIAAAEADPDADVTVLQKLDHLGGSTTMAMGSFSAAGTALQEARGISDSTDAHFSDIDKFVDSHAGGAGRYFYIDFQGDLADKDNLELRRLLVENGGDTLEWLREQGCEYAGPYAESGHSVPRVHQIVPDTEAYADVLGDRMADLGVDVHYETEAYELVDEDEGGVSGVLARKRGRSNPLVVGARRGVVLATGDYINNRELREEHTTNADAPAINEENTGDGHLMASEVGAELVNMDIQEFFMRVGDPLYTNPEFPTMVQRGAILVNAAGRRFVNEASEYDQVFDATLRQEGRHMYIVFDHEIGRQFTSWPHHISTFGKEGKVWAYLDDYLETDVLRRADSPSALAEKAGLDPDTLAETVRRYNEGVDVDGVTMDEYGRERGRKPLTESPYYVLGPIHPYSVITDGGVAVNADLRVLREDGSTIDGLYAAGVAAGDVLLFGHGHHHCWTFTSGRLAGRTAACTEP
jgi:succinate dehydrogenase/fumarate reductase flavoprotein subunit